MRVIGLGWEWDMQCMGGPSGSLARPSTTSAWIDPTRPCMPATKLYPNHKRFSRSFIYHKGRWFEESIYPTHPDTFSLTEWERFATWGVNYLKFVEKLGRRRGRHNQVSCVELQETLSLHVIEECKKRVVVSVHVQQTNLPPESTWMSERSIFITSRSLLLKCSSSSALLPMDQSIAHQRREESVVDLRACREFGAETKWWPPVAPPECQIHLYKGNK